jgi:signal transduction histidine kinase/ligand-binding sensor domain-containing protein
MLLSMSNARTRKLRLFCCVSRPSPLVYPEPVGRRATRHFLSALLFFLFSIFGSPSAFALDPSLDISQYAHTAWKVRDGFSKGSIFAIAQTPDGSLWLGTDFGLLRFDGVRAVPWQPPAGQQLPGDRIHSLLVARDGTLWIATLKGLASWKDGRLRRYPELDGAFLGPLVEAREGTIWVTTSQPGRLCSVQAGNVKCYGEGSFGVSAWGLYEDRKDNLWVSAATGLWRWDFIHPQHYSVPGEVHNVIEGESGELLLATLDGLKQLVRGRVQSCALPGITGRLKLNGFLRSSDGSLWVASQEGLLHVHRGRTDTFGAADGLSGDNAFGGFEDREGNVWVTTTNGLDRFREYLIPTISVNQGLSTSAALAVQATSDAAVWISTTNGVNRWLNGRVTVYGRQTATGQGARGLAQRFDDGLSDSPRSLGMDDQNRLWVATRDGMFYFNAGRFIPVRGAPGDNIWSITSDGHGKMWVNNGTVGLFYFTPGEAAKPIPWTRFGEKGFGAQAVLPDRSNGGVWLGFWGGRAAYFKNGQVRVSYTVADGLGNGRVRDLRFGSGGDLWAGTEGGLSRIRDGRVLTLTTKNGLPCDTVHWSIEDDDHFVWLYMPCGLVRIPRSELDAWVNDPNRKVQVTTFDGFDGVRTLSTYGGYGPRVTKAADGRIWFVTYDGISVIDPRHLPTNKLPPPVHIEQITADDKALEIATGMHLPTGVRHLDIDYTALSLAVPEKVRFRVKLEGEDKDWRELVNVRHVEYTNLPPKHYKFRVLACNNSGVWNEEGAALDFVIPPAWYQTNWFRASCVAAFLALLWAFYQYRLHQLARQFNMRMEERLGERTRIARDLHDTLLQSFQGLVFRFQGALNQLPNRPEKAYEVLESALIAADQAIAEGRSAIQELRSGSSQESNLEQSLLATGRELASSQNGEHGSPPLRVIVEGTRRAERAMIREEIYRIARELLRNAYRHAQARSIEAELRYDDAAFVLIVRDDGKGIDPQVLKDRGRAGHWGLRGLYERAEGMGARLDVWSEAGAGTEVRLTVPGTIAYEKPGDGGRFKLFRKTRIYEHRS